MFVTIYQISLWKHYSLSYIYFYHVLLFHGTTHLLPNLLDIWRDLNVDNIMFWKDMFKDWPAPHLFQCGWYFNSPKNNTPTLEIPLRESIEPSFMETFKLCRNIGWGWEAKNYFQGKGKIDQTSLLWCFCWGSFEPNSIDNRWCEERKKGYYPTCSSHPSS